MTTIEARYITQQKVKQDKQVKLTYRGVSYLKKPLLWPSNSTM